MKVQRGVHGEGKDKGDNTEGKQQDGESRGAFPGRWAPFIAWRGPKQANTPVTAWATWCLVALGLAQPLSEPQLEAVQGAVGAGGVLAQAGFPGA